MAITIKTPEEIEKMRISGRLAADVLQMIEPHVQAGISTNELDQICHDYIVNEQNSIPAPLNYRGFPKSICSIRAKRLVQTTYECLKLGIEMVKPGVHLGDIGHTIQHHAEKNNYSVVREYCGHGIGRDFHEDPQVLHYGLKDTGLIIEEGMIFTIEPMINMGKRHVKLLPDEWTVVTKDRSLSAQWEHTVLVTVDGHEVLTRRDDEVFN